MSKTLQFAVRWKQRLGVLAMGSIALNLLGMSAATGGVVVLANRTTEKIDFTIRLAEGQESRHTLISGDVLSVPTNGQVAIAFESGGQLRRYVMPINSIQCFLVRDRTIDLIEAALPGSKDAVASDARPPAAKVKPGPVDGVCVIPVRVLVDDDEPTVKSVWEKRLRSRVAAASEIFERCCRVRFEVVATGTWAADPKIRSFDRSLEEFERKVPAAPARLAIGFTARYEWLPTESHLGGTHGLLQSHILIRNAVQRVSEPERLEVLVHELGHFLGGVHSSDHTSAMRPILGDGQARHRDFRIGFDPCNTLIISLLGQELRAHPLYSFLQVSAENKATLRGAFAAMAEAMPTDLTAQRYVAWLDSVPRMDQMPGPRSHAIIDGARTVVDAIAKAAERNQQARLGPNGTELPSIPMDGDELAEYLVRQAAAAAVRLPADIAGESFLMGLGVGMGDGSRLGECPEQIWRLTETDPHRTARLAKLGIPTMQGRREWSQGFTSAAAMVVLLGTPGAISTVAVREVVDSQKSVGFRFPNLCADLAGVTFARGVMEGKISLTSLSKSFSVQDYMPKMDWLPDRLSSEKFVRLYGTSQTEQFHREEHTILDHIYAMPNYKALAPAPGAEKADVPVRSP